MLLIPKKGIHPAYHRLSGCFVPCRRIFDERMKHIGGKYFRILVPAEKVVCTLFLLSVVRNIKADIKPQNMSGD